MSAYQTGVHLDEVPFRTGGFQHILGVDAHQVENLRQLVDESDVDVALAVLDDLGGLGHLDARSPVGAVLKH